MPGNIYPRSLLFTWSVVKAQSKKNYFSSIVGGMKNTIQSPAIF